MPSLKMTESCKGIGEAFPPRSHYITPEVAAHITFGTVLRTKVGENVGISSQYFQLSLTLASENTHRQE